jgi:hypothetical protein
MRKCLFTIKCLITVFCFLGLVGCGQTSSPADKPVVRTLKNAAMTEGKDYVILKRFRVIDNQGFSEPIETSSFLLPANWQLNGGIQWNAGSKCIPEMVQASLQAQSPDGDYQLLVLPVTQFDWSDDPVYLDAMQKGFNPHSCNIAQPADAAGYIAQGLAPSLGAQLKSAKTIDALQQQMDAGAAQMTSLARSAGNNAYSHRGSAAEGSLQFSDGKEGLAFCTLMQTIVTMPGTQGNMANTFQCYVSMRIVIKFKPGNEAMARKIMSTLFSSTRINPQWWNGLQRYFMAVGKAAQDATWRQIQIAHEAQEEIGNNIVRSWENNNGSDRAANGDYGEGFSQYLRGVQTWKDENGNEVELTDGYSNAWKRKDGSYLLTNDPSFDPNVTLQEDWSRLNP